MRLQFMIILGVITYKNKKGEEDNGDENFCRESISFVRKPDSRVIAVKEASCRWYQMFVNCQE